VTRNPLPTVTTERPKTAPEAESAKRPYVPKQTPATSSNPISAGTSTTSGNSGDKKPRPAPTCNRCNRYPGRKENYQIPHTWTTCPWQGHPCANHEQHVAWADSANGKRWAMVGFKYLPKEFTLDALGNKVPLNPPLQGNYQLLGGTTSTKSLRLLKSGILNVRLTLCWKKFKFKSLKSKLNEHIMNSTQSSSIDIDEALLSSSNEEERRKLAKSFGGDWSEGEEDANQNRAILKELYEKELVNEANKCFLLKSRAYNDNINDALIPAIAIELKVIY
jgi:hypothetical protein